MSKSIISVIRILLIFGIMVLLGLVFVPRNYIESAFQESPNTKFWDLNADTRIAYQSISKDSINDNFPIIFLHGGPGGLVTNEMLEIATLLSSKSYDVYLYDQIGSGASSRLENIREYTVERHVKDLEQIVKNIGSEKVILLANSWGTMLAMEFLALNPDQVDKIILTGPGPILPINNQVYNIKSPDSLNLISPEFSNSQGNKKAYNLRMRFVRFCAIRFGIKLASDQEVDEFFTYLSSELNKSTSCKGQDIEELNGGRGYYAHIMTLNSFMDVEDKRSSLEENLTKTLIIKGQCDNQKWGFTQEYLELLPNSTLQIIIGAGHIIRKEHRVEYDQLIQEFLIGE